jgi:KTSC domain
MPFRAIQIPPSTNLQSVNYDDTSGQLQIIFQRENGEVTGVYVYEGVPGTVADGFQTSGQSAGAYFRSAIRNQFPYQRVG